jgi:carboxyl-terminal processing protease
VALRFRSAFLFSALLLAPYGCSNPTASPTSTAAETTIKPTASPPPPTVVLPEVERDPREPILAQGVSTFLAREHLRHRQIDDATSREAFAEYLDRLDGGKLFLLGKHVAELRKLESHMDDELAEGNLHLARVGAGLLQQRRKVVAAMIADILTKPFDFTKEESAQTDPEKLAFATTDSELRDRWRKLLKLQVLERIQRMSKIADALANAEELPDGAGGADAIAKIPDDFTGKEKKAREELATSYEARFKRQEDLDPLEPVERFLNAIAAVFDPHTLYLAPADKANFDISMSGSLEGIGAALGVKDHLIEVRELVPGGASWRQGKLEKGDLILAVAQKGKPAVDVTDMPIDKVVAMIRGPKGTVVTLTVKKPDGRVERISITRDVVVIEAAYARGAILNLNGSKPVGYINLPSFYGSTRRAMGGPPERSAAEDVGKLLGVFAKSKIDGVVLDLRGNGGGLLSHARDIVGHFIATGPVVQSRDSKGELEIVADRDPAIAFDGEVVVLVDRFSASASEIVAGALQDYQRALIVGTGPTHGKGTVQILVDLDRMKSTQAGPSLGVLKLTIQQYFRVNGASTQARGVVPDVVLPDPNGYIESGERFLDHPIPWSSVDPLRFNVWKSKDWVVKGLADRSKSRVAKEKAFEKIEARNQLLEARQKDTIVPLNSDAWNKRRETFEEKLEKVDTKLDEFPERFGVKAVNYAKGQTEPTDEGVKKRLEEWRSGLAHDPWVEESLKLLDDMRSKSKLAATPPDQGTQASPK